MAQVDRSYLLVTGINGHDQYSREGRLRWAALVQGSFKSALITCAQRHKFVLFVNFWVVCYIHWISLNSEGYILSKSFKTGAL